MCQASYDGVWGILAGGKADVELDPDFFAVVQTDDYHVFLTAYDGVGALRVARQTAAGFAVEEIGGASSGAFRYRVVAKPKSEHKAERLAKFVIPDIKVPQPPPMVTTPPAKASDDPPQPAPPSRPATPAAISAPSQGGTPAGTQPTVEPLPPSR